MDQCNNVPGKSNQTLISWCYSLYRISINSVWPHKNQHNSNSAPRSRQAAAPRSFTGQDRPAAKEVSSKEQKAGTL